MRKVIIIIVDLGAVVNLSLRCHPDVLFSYSSSHVELIMRVENIGDHPVWAEADVMAPEHVSLAPGGPLKKGRVRVGIVGKKEFLEKSVRVYSTTLASPQIYRCNIILYIFNKDGIIESRIEKPVDVRCEVKKEASL
jgi:hypothetical protein